MPYKEKKVNKKWYRIGEVAKDLKIFTSQIRFWEETIPHLAPARNRKGNRKYNDSDLAIIKTIHHLRNVKKSHTLEGIIQYLDNPPDYAKLSEQVEDLKRFIDFLAKHYDAAFSIAHIHHFRVSDEDIEEGKRLREKIGYGPDKEGNSNTWI
jgi:DNA-binding transcriptional MerR regulator